MSKDKEEIRRALKSYLLDSSVLSFHPESFSSDFLQEVETLPFFSQKKRVVLYDIDKLGLTEMDRLCRYLTKPSGWVSLYLTASELSAQSKVVKLVEKQGKVLNFKEEKPWDKEKRVAEWLVLQAKKEGIALTQQTATILVQGIDHQLLESELQKLICFVYPRKEITLKDVSSLSLLAPNETIWKLSDALLTCATKRALEIGRSLLNEGVAIFSLLAALRSQFTAAMKMLSSGVSTNTSFLEKKVHMYRKYGNQRLQRGVLLIFDAEMKAKNSSLDPNLLLELLTLKLAS